MKNPMKRRTFLRLGAATGLASGLSFNAAQAASSAQPAAGQGVKKYATLGRTGLKISDISFGSSRLRNGEEHLVRHALDMGVNYFDTAEGYTDGMSETVMGKALKGDRDKVYLATKMGAKATDSAEHMMSTLEGSLRRLQTDYVDVYFNWAINDIERLDNPEWFKFVDKAKEQGKIRFTGISGHSGHLAECVEHAVAKDMVDVLLVATNFGEDPSFYERFTKSFDFVANQQPLPAALAKAKANNIGIIAMKVLRGAKLNDMRAYEDKGWTYSQAAFKWILSNPDVDAAIITMNSTDRINEYLGASGEREVTARDMELLERYAAMTNMSYCRHSCSDCEGSCPYGVPIADVLRTRMYATDYGDLAFAKSEYARLDHNASPCLSCDGAPCQDACTHSIPIAQLCGPTHQLLT